MRNVASPVHRTAASQARAKRSSNDVEGRAGAALDAPAARDVCFTIEEEHFAIVGEGVATRDRDRFWLTQGRERRPEGTARV